MDRQGQEEAQQLAELQLQEFSKKIDFYNVEDTIGH